MHPFIENICKYSVIIGLNIFCLCFDSFRSARNECQCGAIGELNETPQVDLNFDTLNTFLSQCCLVLVHSVKIASIFRAQSKKLNWYRWKMFVLHTILLWFLLTQIYPLWWQNWKETTEFVSFAFILLRNWANHYHELSFKSILNHYSASLNNGLNRYQTCFAWNFHAILQLETMLLSLCIKKLSVPSDSIA